MIDIFYTPGFLPVLTGATTIIWMIIKGLLQVAPNDKTLLSTTYENPAVKAICWIWIGGLLVSVALLHETTNAFGWIGKPAGNGNIFGQPVTGEFVHKLSWNMIYANWVSLFIGGFIIHKINVILDTPILRKKRRDNTFN